MIEIDPKLCAGCQRCCHGTPGDYIPATLIIGIQNTGNRPKINDDHRCNHLNTRNRCNYGLLKPLECAIYPIVIFGGDVYVDMSCPGWKDAVRQWCERFGGAIDEYEPDKKHKFVRLWMAKMIKE